MSEGQIFAHSNAGIECLDTKVHSAVNISQVRQLDPAARSNVTNTNTTHTLSLCPPASKLDVRKMVSINLFFMNFKTFVQMSVGLI